MVDFPRSMVYQEKTKSFAHQRELYERTRDLEEHALFWEPGVGKTKPVLDTIGHLFAVKKINGALICAPKAVSPNWVLDEIPVHMPDETRKRASVFVAVTLARFVKLLLNIQLNIKSDLTGKKH